MTIIENALSNPVFALIGDTADQMGLRAYVIGGYVRDCFLGRPNKDIDVVVEGSGIALAEAIAAKTGAKVSVYSNFGTAMLHHKGIELEFVGARKESYHRESRKPIVEDGTLEEDQLRRDFTINAMAFSLNKADFGALVDPFGGIKDLSEGIIRTPLEPQQTYSDDPLRMLRAIRFCVQLSTPEHPFHIVQESLQAMYERRERLKILSSERIVEEVNKMLLTDKPSVAFRLMDETGLLEQFLPELTNLKGVETVDGKGHKDNFSHSLQVLDNVSHSPNVWLRWAALLHDIGKAPTKRFMPGLGWTFHGHEVVGARMVPRIFQRLHMPLNEKMKYVQKLVSLHLRPIALVDDEVTDSAVRRLLFDAGDDIDDLMLLSNADITSKNPAKVARLRRNFELVKEKMAEVEEKDAIRNFKNPITGDMVMEIYGIGPCNIIGEIKEYVKEAILDGVIPNTQDAAERLMREKAAQLGLKEK